MPLSAGTPLYRVYDGTWGYDEHNPGYGDARFSPIDDPVHGGRLPSMYLAATPTAALLETVFHDVHHDSARIVYERDLLGKLLARVGGSGNRRAGRSSRSRTETFGVGPRRGRRQPGGTLSLHAASGSRGPRADLHPRRIAGLHLALSTGRTRRRGPCGGHRFVRRPAIPEWSRDMVADATGPDRTLRRTGPAARRPDCRTIACRHRDGAKVALRAALGVASTDLVRDQSWSVNSPKCPGVMNCARASR